MKRSIALSAIFINILLIRTFTYAGGNFIPWNSDIKIADENIRIETKIIYNNPHIYNGAQGGAYFLIRFFQLVISPQDGPRCGFSPTCSAYGRIAVTKYGAVLGGMLTGDRLLRCNPYSAHGADPVPENF